LLTTKIPKENIFINNKQEALNQFDENIKEQNIIITK
jgi:hypothetical protein